jgi:hypothetical protein
MLGTAPKYFLAALPVSHLEKIFTTQMEKAQRDFGRTDVEI